MRAPLFVAALLLTACAGTPPASNSAGARIIDANQVAEMQRIGYTVTDKNGQKLYCRKSLQTGSHINTSTACLTEEQWLRVNIASQHNLDNMNRQSTTLPNTAGH